MTHKLSTGVYVEGGRAVKRPYSVIRPGDFVEVVCMVEITKFRKRSGWGTEARLILQEVLRVCDKDVVQVCSFHYACLKYLTFLSDRAAHCSGASARQ